MLVVRWRGDDDDMEEFCYLVSHDTATKRPDKKVAWACRDSFSGFA